jgi:hypothetical protein
MVPDLTAHGSLGGGFSLQVAEHDKVPRLVSGGCGAANAVEFCQGFR